MLVASVVSVMPAHAQGGGGGGGSQTEDDPGALSVERPYLATQLQGLSALANSAAVSGHVGALLTGFQPFAVGAAPSPAFAYAPPAQGGDDGLAAFAAVAATPKWSTWGNVNATWSDRSDPIAGNRGRLDTGNIALDYRIVDRGVIGVLGSFEHADFDTTFSGGSLRRWGFGGGVYGGYALTDVIVVDGLAQWQALDTDVATPTATGSYGGHRMQLAANITAYLTHAGYSIRPAAGISYTRDDFDAWTDSTGVFTAAQWAATTTGTAGVEVGYVFAHGGGRSIEPWVGVKALLESVKASPAAAVPGRELDPFDVIVSAGLRAQLNERLSFTLRAEVGGLARADYDTVMVDGAFALAF
jgi:outer membrane autotransporter protein